MKRRGLKILLVATCLLTLSMAAPGALAQADVSLCVLHQVTRWGNNGTGLDDVTAYSVGTTSVNVGSVNLNWIQNGTNHPVIGQTMYKIEDGTIEMIGQSWLKHSFCALQIDSACTQLNCPNQGGCLSFLAPGCQDPYSAPRNGSQSLLGPKWQVNANTGEFTWPHPFPSGANSTVNGRLQVHNRDLGHANAVYLVEGQYVARDDALADNQDNNASYRLVSIGAGPTFAIGFVSGQGTVFQQNAINAWKAHGNGQGVPDTTVQIQKLDDVDNGDGLFWVGYKVSDNGDGTWHYEYAIQNVNHHGSARSVTIPLPTDVTLTNIGFHDVDYHSGDGFNNQTYDGTDWAWTVGGTNIIWQTESEAENSNANALRWGTLYNFRFDADAPPIAGTMDAQIGIYRDDYSLSIGVKVPDGTFLDCQTYDFDDDGAVGVGDLLNLLGNWGNPWDVSDLLELLAVWGPCLL